jgi:hypothetical protein
MMGRIIDDDHSRWTDHLPYIMAAYRSAVHNATGYSPNFLMFGRELYTPLDVIIKTPLDTQTPSDEYVDRQQNLLRNAYWMVRDHLNAAMLTNKRYYDESVHKHVYSVGEWVWYYKPRLQSGKSPKWSRLYSGPFRVVQRLSDITYVIQQRPQSQPLIAHIDKLKKYEGDIPTDWIDTPNSSPNDASEDQVSTEDPPPAQQTDPTYARQRYRPRFGYVITFRNSSVKLLAVYDYFVRHCLFAEPQLINASLFFFQYSMQRRRDHIRAPPTYSVFHRSLRSAFTADSWSHAVTVRLRSAGHVIAVLHPYEDTAAVHLSLILVMSTLTALQHREEQRTISRTHSFRRDSPSDNLKTNSRESICIFSLMHVHATIPLPRSILQLHPNHLWRLTPQQGSISCIGVVGTFSGIRHGT